jgi:hypothetical protein
MKLVLTNSPNCMMIGFAIANYTLSFCTGTRSRTVRNPAHGSLVPHVLVSNQVESGES